MRLLLVALLLATASATSSSDDAPSSSSSSSPCGRVLLARARQSELTSTKGDQAAAAAAAAAATKKRGPPLAGTPGASSSGSAGSAGAGLKLRQAKFAVAVLSPDGIFPLPPLKSAASNKDEQADASSSSSSSNAQSMNASDASSSSSLSWAAPEDTDSLLAAVPLRYIDAAQMLVHQLRTLGHDVILTSRFDLKLARERQFIVLAAHHLFNRAQFPQSDVAIVKQVLDEAILFNLELVDSEGDENITPEYIELLQDRCVWDASSINAQRLASVGLTSPVEHVALSFAPWLNREYRGLVPMASLTKDVDLLFLGKISSRARELLTLVQQQGINVMALDGSHERGLTMRERDVLIARAKAVIMLHSSEEAASTASYNDENDHQHDHSHAYDQSDAGEGATDDIPDELNLDDEAAGVAPDWATINLALENRVCILIEGLTEASDDHRGSGSSDSDDPFSDAIPSRTQASKLARGVVTDKSLVRFLADAGGLVVFETASELVDLTASLLVDAPDAASERSAIALRGQRTFEQLDASGNLRRQLDAILPDGMTKFAQRLVEGTRLVTQFETHQAGASDQPNVNVRTGHHYPSIVLAADVSLSQRAQKAHQYNPQDALLERAVGLFEKLTQSAPKSSAALAGMGRALFLLGRYKDAAKYLERARRRNEDDPEIYELLGLAQQSLEEYDEASDGFLAALETTIEQESHHGTALGTCPVSVLVHLADVSAQRDDYERLATVISRLMDCAPGNRDALLAFGYASISLEIPENVDWVLTQLGALDGAEQDVADLDQALVKLRQNLSLQ
ncbi:hypothetical protein CAOG_06188 [Capsaspora owczarzaki ATCC 30864]|uniref:Uncharacterized protein n=1 Tax=Capsaspora owczarzaki (strain ATCC 30864) TaxID=595528 RepID=A0A0D2WTH2_CAPO3|nr:hypothetical protein CAOG_06188 [Capsaspora owczarzaki ATCC 30864]KJE95775.1 hypothetical protein CAOG_006188 [Capsaspora owczarzaki ATCC 30864]|eukprot:XP_004345778.2 hypothetical protein CAOG_06188 [Capsaspora owczarzaki ATCC 30864]